MAVTKFIAKIWEARLLANFHKVSVARAICTKPTEIRGNTIVFNNVSTVGVKDYEGTVDWDELETVDTELEMNQKKYWAFSVGDVDKAQAAGPIIDAHMSEAAATLGEVIDAKSFSIMAAGAGKKLGNKAVTPESAYDLVVDLSTVLNKNKVPKTDRYCIIDSDYLGLLSKDPRFTKQPNILENGVVEGQKIANFNIAVSEELPKENGRTTIIGMHRLGLGLGEQLNETEAMRLQAKFGDGVRGLCVFGAEVLKKECVVTANVSVGTVGVSGLTLDKTQMTLKKGTTDTLIGTVAPSHASNQNVTYVSSDVAKATVDANGVVKGIAAGSSTITVTTVDGGKTATCEVEVTA